VAAAFEMADLERLVPEKVVPMNTIKSKDMRSTRTAWLAKIVASTMLATAVVSGQTSGQQRPNSPSTARPAQTPQTPQAPQTPPSGAVFRAEANYVPLDVTPRDAKGQFVPNLTRADFHIFEDGVEQTIGSFGYAIGGRMYGDFATPAPVTAVTEGLMLPKARPPADVAGRLFFIFIDDLHLTPDLTPQVRKVLNQIRNTVLHDNDLVGFVSTGYSSIEMDPAYDYNHRRFDEVVNKTMGSGPTIQEMIDMRSGADGLAELNHNINVAFSTARDILVQLESVTNMRKAFIWVSSGYSLNPFKDARLQKAQNLYNELNGTSCSAEGKSPQNSGLIAGLNGASMQQAISYGDQRDFVEETTSTLKVLAEQTGGLAAVNTNDFRPFLLKIDNVTSDYYMIGYQSSNPDPLHRFRKIVVKVDRPGIQLVPGQDYRQSYTLKPPAKAKK
jgi:VWFA-related protein